MHKPLKFKVSSALKDIIGQDLITDEFVAVFELVKNAIDAHASRIDIYFIDIYGQAPAIRIEDNGKGMSFSDLRDKWLFVAYSAKKEGTEDHDYRKNIYQNRPFAGAKGIGRFSCDKLGSSLLIETKRLKDDVVHTLNIDWTKFEEDLRAEFIDVEVDYAPKKVSNDKFKKGTILNISELRTNWDREKLLRLKDSLAKLINPIKGNEENEFKIQLHVNDELKKDSEYDEDEYFSIVNGPIKNFVFETLDLKTTKIFSSISSDGKYIDTILYDGGTKIYQIKEVNHFRRLKNIDITLYYLNRSAKMSFAKKMGLASRLYGHIFLYNNGFRVFPFGEPYEDPLKVDLRKSRKTKSRLGTGELIGQIEIFAGNPLLKEASSRGNGLQKNEVYEQLADYRQGYFISVLERLEKYVIEVQKWGLSIEDGDDTLKKDITKLLAFISNSKDIVEFDVPNDFLELLDASQAESAEAVIGNLNKIASAKGDKKLLKVVSQATSKLKEIQEARIEAEDIAAKAEAELEERVSENLFLKSIKSKDLEEVINLMHHIGVSTSTIQHYIKGISFRIGNDIPITNNELKTILGNINNEVSKIYSISRLATKANFKMSTKPTYIDVIDFLTEYLQNVVRPFLPSKLSMEVKATPNVVFKHSFRPLELTIVIDNLINNSKKANAKHIRVLLEKKGEKLQIIFKDDGIGIPIENMDRVFDYGFTTTDGSGLGLTSVKDIIEKNGGSIILNRKIKQGAEFIITF